MPLEMQSAVTRVLLAVLLIGSSATRVTPQTPATPIANAQPRNSAEFEGHYEYRDGATLFIVASGERLVAIIGEGKYALRAAGVDTFTNAGGQSIPFLAFTLDRSQRNEFGQIYLRPRDMLKLGILIQRRGEWEGHRVVSAAWIDAAVTRQSRVDDSDYGLGIWHRWYQVQTPAGGRRVDTIMLSGNGGQKVYSCHRSI